MITKEEFLKYEKVRQSGKYNMIMDAAAAWKAAGLARCQYFDIIENYDIKQDYNYVTEEDLKKINFDVDIKKV